ncbi:hypothetical protein DSO57_1005937 [Entomophthora muscae]|uniref:Uncharacterized protein n=1 Tax=Entomophthora muscae TaxID=34485 RepID=A0ACC2RYS1_9FUNG|nr:hypothetical protein DSO57_1005937 [Entomophthora muscae]
MLEIPPTSPLPTVPPAQDFSKLGFVYITVLGLDNQVVPHTGNWQSLATAVNYLVRILPTVYLAFQAWPASSAGVQLDSGMGHDNSPSYRIDNSLSLETWAQERDSTPDSKSLQAAGPVDPGIS